MSDCLFDKIIAKEIPASIIYEDDVIISFLDIRPTNKGHALVVPKKHSRNILDIEKEDRDHLFEVVQKISKSMQEILAADGITIVMNNEPAGGQEVFHSHVHVIPRFEDDEIFQTPKHSEYEDGEMDIVAKELRKFLS